MDRSKLKAAAGTWIEVDAPMLEGVLPADAEIIVGGSGPLRPWDVVSKCFVCGGVVRLSLLDFNVIETNPKIVRLCCACAERVL